MSSLTPPHSALFDVVLILHVASVAMAIVTLGALYGSAMSFAKLGEDDPWPRSAIRFFHGNHEVAARSIYLIPLSGVVLVGVSQRHFALSTSFVLVGIILWTAGLLVSEGIVFPARNRIARALVEPADAERVVAVQRQASALRWGVDGVLVTLVAGIIVMVAQP